MRILFIVLLLSGCADLPYPFATEVGQGTSNQVVIDKVWSWSKTLHLAEAYCQKMGKFARIAIRSEDSDIYYCLTENSNQTRFSLPAASKTDEYVTAPLVPLK